MSAPLAFWVHDLSPFLVRFSDTFGIRYYGLAYVLGFWGAAWLLRQYTRHGKATLPVAAISDLMVALVIGVFVGGRFGYFLFYQPQSLAHDPLVFFRVWEGGMASHGGFLGVAIAVGWCAHRQKLGFYHLSDLVASVTALGLLLGRIANFINGELWGRTTSVAWAVIFPDSAAPGTPIAQIPPRHPSQLYEAALEGAFLLVYAQWRVWRTPVLLTSPGRLTGEFLALYAIGRAIGEHFREPDAGLILGLSRGTFYSIFLFAAGVIVVLRSSRQQHPLGDRP